MRAGILLCIIMAGAILAAGCLQLPGIHVLANAPDPVIGQWIGGEPPASDLHVIFFENHTYRMHSFYLSQLDKTESGTWTRNDSRSILSVSSSGNATRWSYEPADDSLYVTGLPQQKYYRYKG